MGGGPGRETVINGRRCLYFGGTGYFGLQSDPELIASAREALDTYGLGPATSRDLFGTIPPYIELERFAARFFGAEDAVYLPSGYLVNIAAFQALSAAGRFDAVFVDERAHWSIADFVHALRKPVFVFAHRDPADLRARLKELRRDMRPLVATDGIFPTFGRIAPVPEYLEAVEPYDGCIWLDDCHAIGVLGANGRGTYEHYGLASERLYYGGTLSKAAGAHGGIVPGPAGFVQTIRAGHIVNGSNPPPAAAAAAALRGLELLTGHPEMRECLWTNARRLKQGLRALGFEQDDSPVPICAWALPTPEAMDYLHRRLLERGVCIQRTHYVGAGAHGVLRAVVFATHTAEDIDRLLTELKPLV